MDKNMRKNLSIPQEIMFEIFSWLPAKSLMRLKCVSTVYNSMISESNFLDIHRCRTGGTKFLLQGVGVYYTAEEKKDGKTSASFLQVERINKIYNRAPTYSRLDCVNGLFCGWGSSSIVIFNPCTKEVRFLPDLNKDIPWCNYLLGFEPKEKKYKVVLTSYHAREGYIKYWIFTIGVDKSWRESQSIFPCVPSSRPSVCISGVIYQFAVSNYKYAMVAFDVKSENFEIIALWNAFESEHHHPLIEMNHPLIEVKGKLAVIDSEKRLSGYVDMWILEQTPRKKWERHIIGLPLIWNDIKPIFISSCMVSDGEIVFVLTLMPGALCYFCYDVTRKSWRELKINGLPKENDIDNIYSYVESLVPLG